MGSEAGLSATAARSPRAAPLTSISRATTEALEATTAPTTPKTATARTSEADASDNDPAARPDGAPARISGRPSHSSGESPAPAAPSSSGMPTSALEAPAHTPMATHEHTGANGDSPPGSFNEAPRRPVTRRPQRVAPLPDGAYSAGSPDSSFSDPNEDDPPRSAQRGAHPCPYPQ